MSAPSLAAPVLAVSLPLPDFGVRKENMLQLAQRNSEALAAVGPTPGRDRTTLEVAGMGIVSRVCVHCQTPFLTEYETQVYCAPKCRVLACRKRMAPLAVVPCQECGAPMAIKRREQLPGGNRPQQYCSYSCRNIVRARAFVANPIAWRGGRRATRYGYVEIWIAPTDALALMRTRHGTILEHRVVMARHLGRLLTSGEVVHHVNGDKQDNRIENLRLLTPGEHTRLHSGEMLEKRWQTKRAV